MSAATNAAGTAGGDAHASGAAASENAVPARTPRFAPKHPLSLILANQAVTADRYGDADRIAHLQHAHGVARPLT